MDKKTIDRLFAQGKQKEVESEIRRLQRENAKEHKRVSVDRLVYRQGISEENVGRALSKRFDGEVKKSVTHRRPDAEQRKANKKKMRSRRR